MGLSVNPTWVLRMYVSLYTGGISVSTVFLFFFFFLSSGTEVYMVVLIYNSFNPYSAILQ